MKKLFCAVLSLLALCTIATAAGSKDGSTGSQKVTIKWASVHPPAHPASQTMMRVAEEVAKQTDGRVEIKGFPGGQLGGSMDLIHGTQTGIVDMVSEGAANFGQYVPSVTIAEAPYIWRNVEHLEKAMDGAFGQKINDELIKGSGMRLLGAMYYGTRHLSTSKKEVRTVADCSGMKIRVPENDVFVAMARSWGANPTPITFNELYLALQQNIVDGQENPLPTFSSAKFQEVQKCVILTGHIMTPMLIVINEKVWQKISPADREIVKASIAKHIKWQNEEIVKQENDLIAKLRSQGVTIITPDVESFRQATLKVVPPMFEAKWGKGTWDTIQNIK